MFHALFDRLGLRKARPEARDWRAEGNAALARDDLDEAERCYRAAVDADARDPLARLNLGFVLLERDPAGAAACLVKAIKLAQPGDDFLHEAHYLLGRARAAQGQNDKALTELAEAVRLEPGFAPAVQAALSILRAQGRHHDALAWAQRWARARPSPSAWLAVAQCAYQAHRPRDAADALDAVLAAEPDNVAALEGRASLALDENRTEQALADFDAALRSGASGASVHYGRAMALRRCGRSADALAAIGQVLAANAAYPGALAQRAAILLEMLRPAEAAVALDEAVRLHPDDPDLVWGRATARLLAGDLEGGWTDHEVRFRAPSAGVKVADPHRGVPWWTGREDLRGRNVLVVAEQGLGDALQFMRYLPLLQERGATVTFQVQPALHALVQDAMPGVRVVHGGVMQPPDYQAYLLSLPRAFGTTLATVPARIPYLRSRPELRAAWEERLGPRQGLRVGVVWSGGTLFAGDARRSLALETFRAIDQPGVQFVCLQKEIRERDRAALAAWPALSCHDTALQSFADTAALTDCMDLVISSCTSVAHLAGGLGRPLWLMLPYQADWRWMVHREDSPWYPTARLFRQAAPGDWPGVLQRVRTELQALARSQPAMPLAPGPGTGDSHAS